jgi:cell division protease FtsH
MARNMATKWGLSDELGPMSYGEDEDEVFLGRSVTQHKNVSNETARKIDEVVRTTLDRAYARSKELLTTNIDKLHIMADALLQYETIDARQIDDIMNGREPGPPADWSRTGSTPPTPPPPPKGDAGSTVGKPATQI